MSIKPAQPGRDPIRAVIDGEAEFGVGTSELILHRARGEPVVCMTRDVTESRLQQELKQAAHYDNLTGLVNRRLILELLRNAIATAKRMEKALAVLFLDLDGFKHINDAYGHQMGDELLKILALRLKGMIRESDYLGRLAGDEFLVVLQDIHSRSDAQQVIDKIQSVVEEPCYVEASILHITVSVGLALYPENGESLDALVLGSDKAMYQVKASRKRAH